MQVSILMPAYNAARHLPEAISSVLCQTHQDFTLIVINDGSTDHTLQILKEFAAKDARIRIISHENQGMGASLNHALREVDSDWVFRMDADDVMFPDRIERQLSYIRKTPDLKVTACLAQYIDEQGKSLYKTAHDLTTREKFNEYVRNGEAIGLLHPGVAFHRQTILEAGGYRDQFWPADDIDLWNRLAEKGHLILVQPEVLMQYRLHGGSVITSGFYQSRLKYEWVRACMRARRSNSTEPDWDTFISGWNDVSWWVKVNRSRKISAKYYYRKAGFDKMTGRTLQAVFEMTLAAALQPVYTLRKMKRQMFR